MMKKERNDGLTLQELYTASSWISSGHNQYWLKTTVPVIDQKNI